MNDEWCKIANERISEIAAGVRKKLWPQNNIPSMMFGVQFDENNQDHVLAFAYTAGQMSGRAQPTDDGGGE